MSLKKIGVFCMVLGMILLLTGCFLKPSDIQRGKLLSFNEITRLPKAFLQAFLDAEGISLTIEYGMQTYGITYETVALDGTALVESGLVILPWDDTGVKRDVILLPLLSMQHGTIFSRDLSPSRFEMNLSTDNPEDYIGIIIAGLGYAVMMPDYMGLGVDDTIIHPFCHAASIADSVLDMIRAGQAFLLQKPQEMEWNQQLFLAGYSEGGYATMAASRMIQQQYPNEFSITAAAPLAGPYNLSGVMRDLVVQNPVYEHLAFLAYLVLGYNEVYDFYESPSEVFLQPYDTTLPNLMDGTHSEAEVNAALPGNGVGKADTFLTSELIQQLNDPDAKVYQSLVANDLYNTWVPQMPLFMVHSAVDEAVPVENSRTAVAYYLSQGSSVTYIELAQGTHVETYLPAYLLAIDWLETFVTK